MSGEFKTIGLIGLGEVGGIFATELTKQNCVVKVYDVLIHDSGSHRSLQMKAESTGANLCGTMAEAVTQANLVISAVTATSAKVVAEECGRLLRAEQYYMDVNSISPKSKIECAASLQQNGASYIEAAVMAPVPPTRLKVPILLGGKDASLVGERLRNIGFNVRCVSADIGVASAIKMCRSVVIKGLEALTVECLFAARRYGAEDQVLGSLHASFPSLGWAGEFPDYLISRVAEHGRRRAAELREVAATLRDVGIAPTMAEAIASRQDALIDALQSHSLSYESMLPFSWRALADSLREDK